MVYIVNLFYHICYTDDNNWTKHYHECSGRSQSPIDIHVKKTKHDPSLSLHFKGYSYPLDGSLFQLSNNGHTVELNLVHSFMNADDIPVIKGPALEDMAYKFVQLHFHWHTNDTLGSEHAIDGQRYALEVSNRSSSFLLFLEVMLVLDHKMCAFFTRLLTQDLVC